MSDKVVLRKHLSLVWNIPCHSLATQVFNSMRRQVAVEQAWGCWCAVLPTSCYACGVLTMLQSFITLPQCVAVFWVLLQQIGFLLQRCGVG